MNLTLEDAREYGAASSVLETLTLIEQLGGRCVHSSNHAKSPLWVYDFSGPGDIQIAVPLNRKKLSIYMRGGMSAGDAFETAITATGAVIQPKESGGRHTGLNGWPGLSPNNGRVILVDAQAADIETLLRTYLARGGAALPTTTPTGAFQPAANEGAETDAVDAAAIERAITPEMLRRRLERNDEVGRAGECVAYAEEVARLTALGCPTPSSHVCITAETDVAAGYDIRSEWQGEVRCIEVKSSTVTDRDFFLTANERVVLTALGERAWLYRVRIDGDGNGEVVQRLRNPMSKIPDAAMQPVVWRVDLTSTDVRELGLDS